MIIVYTSLHYGAMVQYTIKLTETLNKLGNKAVALIPEDSITKANCPTITYKREKTYSPYSSHIRNLVKIILSHKPDIVFFAEHSLNTAFLAIAINKKVNSIITVHDASAHPSNSVLFRIKERIKQPIITKAFNSVSKLLLMSENTKNTFLEKNKKYSNRVIVLPLGAHVPNCIEMKPKEIIKSDLRFILFFGRIDKYKGIENLLDAFLRIYRDCNSYYLIIAGSGTFTKTEKNKISQLRDLGANVIIINRFISDSEMLWLFKECQFICLPYIEASQSGVLPIAYYYAKPALVSNIPGLTQFVQNGINGFIFNSVEDLSNKIRLLCTSDNTILSKNAQEYYLKYLDWDNNLKHIMKYLK